MYFVYEMYDPQDGIPRYVGITNNPNARLQQHLDDINSNYNKIEWIQKLLMTGVTPEMRILDIVDNRKLAQEREKYWIHFYGHQSITLYNVRQNRSHKPKEKRNVRANSRIFEKAEVTYTYQGEELLSLPKVANLLETDVWGVCSLIVDGYFKPFTRKEGENYFKKLDIDLYQSGGLHVKKPIHSFHT